MKGRLNLPLCLVLCGMMLSVTLPAHAAGPATTPSEDQLKPLISGSLLDFNDAIQHKNFVGFHGRVSKLLAAKLSADDMLRAFDDFIKKDVNIEGVKDVDPVLDSKPSLDENGVLLVKGSYPTTPYRVLFTLKYLTERQAGKDQWKLVGLMVDVKKIPTPADPDLRKMATKTLLDFNAGVHTKDFKPFLETTAKVFRDQFTSEKLIEAFKDFVDKDVDISMIKSVDPVFDKPPGFSDDKANPDAGWALTLEGHYPTPDLHVYFSLKYMPEGTGWRLISIDVNTKKAD